MNAKQGREGGGEVSYTEETHDSLFHAHPLSHDKTSFSKSSEALLHTLCTVQLHSFQQR